MTQKWETDWISVLLLEECHLRDPVPPRKMLQMKETHSVQCYCKVDYLPRQNLGHPRKYVCAILRENLQILYLKNTISNKGIKTLNYLNNHQNWYAQCRKTSYYYISYTITYVQFLLCLLNSYLTFSQQIWNMCELFVWWCFWFKTNNALRPTRKMFAPSSIPH